jgi:hypothetical protein
MKPWVNCISTSLFPMGIHALEESIQLDSEMVSAPRISSRSRQMDLMKVGLAKSQAQDRLVNRYY